MIDPTSVGLLAHTAPRDIGGPGTCGRVLHALAAARPDDVVLVGRSGRLRAAEMRAAVDRAAAALWALGVREGSRVGASLPNDTDIVVAFFATMRLGAIWVGMNRPLAPPEKAYMLRDSGAVVFLTDAAIAASLAPLRDGLPELRHVAVLGAESADEWRELLSAADPSSLPPDPGEPFAPAAIAYTSGTTGFPKGAVHSQHNLLLPGLVRARTSGDVGGVLGVPLPLTIINLMVLGPLVAWQQGTTVVAMDRVDAVGMAEWIQAERVTTFSAVPAMVHDLLTHPDVTDEMLASIDAIGVGGADMPDAFRRLYEARFGTRVGTGYGLTEAPTAVTVEDVSQPPVPGSCGRALPQVRIHVLDEQDRPVPAGTVGEVCVGPADDGPFADVYRPMLGYWNRPEATAEALRGGLLHTGDLGALDADGNLAIKDRRNDLIIRGGSNVYPAEVERVLHDEPSVAACAVVGVPDERLGERVVAFVQLAPEAPGDAEARLLAHCREQLARYKVPDRFLLVDGFDRTPMGKIRKGPLREAATAAAADGPA